MSIYLNNIPTGIVNLDVDYKNIQNNFSQLDTSFGINHFPFSENTIKNGKHTYINMVDNVSIPSGVNVLVANEGTLYTKTNATVTEMFYTPDASLNEYQMTRTVAASFALFATNTTYPGAQAFEKGEAKLFDSCPFLSELKKELTMQSYTVIDKQLILESKDKIKQRLGMSPDIADAVMMAYSLQVDNSLLTIDDFAL